MDKKFVLSQFLGCLKDAARMADIFNEYYSPGTCDFRQVMKLYRESNSEFILIRDTEKGGLIAGFAIIVPVTNECFAQFIQGKIFGLGRAPYPSTLFAKSDADKFIIDCLMTSPQYRNSGLWVNMMNQAAFYLSRSAGMRAQVAAETNLETGHIFYRDILLMDIAIKTNDATVYKSTLKNLTSAIVGIKPSTK